MLLPPRITAEQIQGIEQDLYAGKLLDDDQQAALQMLLAYRQQLFVYLSSASVPDAKGVLNELAKLFRVEAICVGLQLQPFYKAMKFIIITTSLAFGFVIITCIAELASVIRHW